MTFAGVPILDWVLLVVLIGLGIEAWVTTRPPRDERARPAHPNGEDPTKPEG